VCDLETSRMGAPYIYDISRLRVNVPDGLNVKFHYFLIGPKVNNSNGSHLCNVVALSSPVRTLSCILLVSLM